MKNFISILVSLALVMLISFTSQAAFKYVFELPFSDQGNPGKDVGGKNNATLSKGANWVKDANFGGAMECNGTDGYAEVKIDIPEKNFTMGVWVNTADPEAGIMSVLDGAAGAGGHDRHFFLKGGVVNFRVWKGGGWASTAKVADGKWHQIVLVVQDKVGQIAYVDGKEVGKNDYDHSDFDWQKLVWIGFSNDAAKQYLKGLIRYAVYIDGSLTANEVNQLYLGQQTAVESENKATTTWGNIKK